MIEHSSSDEGWRSGFRSVGLDANWPVLRAQIQGGQYDLAFETISRLLALIDQESSDAYSLLRAAIELCQACKQTQGEVGWYEKTRQEAAQRENKLRQELLNLLLMCFNDEIAAKDPYETQVISGGPDELSGTPHNVSTQSMKSVIFRRLREWLIPKSGSNEEIPSQSPDRPSTRQFDLIAKDAEQFTSQVPTIGEQMEQATLSETKDEVLSAPKLVVYCLGVFRVYQDDQPVNEWSGGKSKAIFKYLVTHRQIPVIKDVLMDLFWPDIPPEAARNNLNVAIYGLRQTLRKTRNHFSHILFMHDSYLLNPDLSIWLDCDAFKDCMNAGLKAEKEGDLSQAIREYCAAEEIYQGDFLAEDRYEDWPVVQRQRIQDEYLSLLERLAILYIDQANHPACISTCRKMLDLDPCREQAHRQLMLCYTQLGQPYLALRQYHLCVEALKNDLDVAPSSAIRDLYLHIRHQSEIRSPRGD